jgi:signal transduction histidine kinase
VEQQLAVKGIQLRLNLATASASVKGDPDLLEQVFINFFLNAIESMESGGLLTIESTLQNDSWRSRSSWQRSDQDQVVQVSIRDTGNGISESNLSRIFDPFFTTKQNGTGMGLAVTYSILEDHDAKVDVQSEVGRGTTFIVEFPPLSEQVPAS